MTAAAHFAAHTALATAHGPGIFLRAVVGGHGAPIVGIGAVGIQSGVAAAVAGEIQGAAIRSGRGKLILLPHPKAGAVGPAGGVEPILSLIHIFFVNYTLISRCSLIIFIV